jgi:hypothetical protein
MHDAAPSMEIVSPANGAVRPSPELVALEAAGISFGDAVEAARFVNGQAAPTDPVLIELEALRLRFDLMETRLIALERKA